MNLFQAGKFTLASGKTSNWKIECDALTPEDWDALALMAIDLFGHPGRVCGVPRGGIPFADALKPYIKPDGDEPFWIVDDVLTTGGSINNMRNVLADIAEILKQPFDPVGIVVFARGKKPPWVKSIFTMPDWDEATL